MAGTEYQKIAGHLLGASDDEFLRLLQGDIEHEAPSAWLMLAVAYMNAIPMADGLIESIQANPEKYDVPPHIDTFVNSMAYCVDKTRGGDEIQSRRFMWFFQASLLLRAKKYIGSKKYEDEYARIWINLVKGCELLPGGLTSVIIWTKDEKAYFDHILDGREGMCHCLNHIMPDKLLKNPVIKSFAESKGLEWLLAIYR